MHLQLCRHPSWRLPGCWRPGQGRCSSEPARDSYLLLPHVLQDLHNACLQAKASAAMQTSYTGGVSWQWITEPSCRPAGTSSSSQQPQGSTAGMSAFQKLKSAIPGTAEHKQTHPQTGSDHDSTTATPKHGSPGGAFGSGADSRAGGESRLGTDGNSSTAGQKVSSALPGTAEHGRTHGNTGSTGTDSGYTARDENDNVVGTQSLQGGARDNTGRGYSGSQGTGSHGHHHGASAAGKTAPKPLINCGSVTLHKLSRRHFVPVEIGESAE